MGRLTRIAILPTLTRLTRLPTSGRMIGLALLGGLTILINDVEMGRLTGKDIREACIE